MTYKGNSPIYANGLHFHDICVLVSVVNDLSGRKRTEKLKRKPILGLEAWILICNYSST